MKFLETLKSNKLYTAAVLTVISSVSAAYLGQIDWNTAITAISNAVTAALTTYAVTPKS